MNNIRPSIAIQPQFFTILILALAGLNRASAIPVTFDLRDTSATSEIESGTINRGGITATLTSFVLGGTGSLNQSSSGFGVNAMGTGDDADLLDGGVDAESISINFDQDVLFSGLGLSLLTAGQGDEAALTIASFSAISLTDTGAGDDIFSFAADNFVPAGQNVLLEFVNGNGFSFDSFTINPASKSTTVPDSLPFTCVALTLFGLLALATPERLRGSLRG